MSSDRCFHARLYNKPMAASQRWGLRQTEMTGDLGASPILSEGKCLAVEIIVQHAEQQVILPDSVDAKIAARQPLPREAALFQHTNGRHIARNAGSLDAMQV